MREFVKNISKFVSYPYFFILIPAFLIIWMFVGEIFVIEFRFPKYFALLMQVHIFTALACSFIKYEDDILTMKKSKYIQYCMYTFLSLLLYIAEVTIFIIFTYIGFSSK